MAARTLAWIGGFLCLALGFVGTLLLSQRGEPRRTVRIPKDEAVAHEVLADPVRLFAPAGVARPSAATADASMDGVALRVTVMSEARAQPVAGARVAIFSRESSDSEAWRPGTYGTTEEDGIALLHWPPAPGPSALVVVNHEAYAAAEREVPVGAEEISIELGDCLSITGQLVEGMSERGLPGVRIAACAVRWIESLASDAGVPTRPGYELVTTTTDDEGNFAVRTGEGWHRLAILSDEFALRPENGPRGAEVEIIPGTAHVYRIVRAGDSQVRLRASPIRYVRVKLVDAESQGAVQTIPGTINYDPGGPNRAFVLEQGPVHLGGVQTTTAALSDLNEGIITRRVRFLAHEAIPDAMALEFNAPGYRLAACMCPLLRPADLLRPHTLTVVGMRRIAADVGRLHLHLAGFDQDLWRASGSPEIRLFGISRSRRDAAANQVRALPGDMAPDWLVESWPAGDWEVEVLGGVLRSLKERVRVAAGEDASVGLSLRRAGLALVVRDVAGRSLPRASVRAWKLPIVDTIRPWVGVDGVTDVPTIPLPSVFHRMLPPDASGPFSGTYPLGLEPGAYRLSIAHPGFRPLEMEVEVREGDIGDAVATLAAK